MLESSHPLAHHPTDQLGPASERQLPTSSFQLPTSSFTDYLLALLAAFLALTLYLRTLAPGLLGGDSGEFQFAAWLGGFVHPTGYPLYLVLGYLWSHLLPVHDPAWRMNAFSALWGGVAVGLVYLLVVRMSRVVEPTPPAPLPAREGGAAPPSPHRRGGWGVRSLAIFAALTFAVTPTFWSQAVIAEVYTLHAAFVAAVLLGLVSWAASRNPRTLYVTAAIYGLSLAHHRTMLLLAPAIAVYLWLVWRTPRTTHHAPRPPAPLLAAAFLLPPLLLYAYIPLRAPLAPYASVRVGPAQTVALYEPTWRGFLAYVAGQSFQGDLGAPGQAIARALPAMKLLVNEVTWVGIALGLLGLLWLVVPGRRSQGAGVTGWESGGSQRSAIGALTGLSFLGVFGFNLFYGIGDIFVFYIPAYLIWTLWMAAGVNALATLVSRITQYAIRNTHHASRITSSFVYLSTCLLALILPAWLLVTRFDALDQSRNIQARAAWQALLAQPIPQDAILVTNDRDEMMPLWYMQHVEGVRPDLTGLFPVIRPEPAWTDVGGVTSEALRSGRPVFLVKPMPGLEVKFDLEPAGALVRVLGPAAANPPARPADALYADAIRLTGYDLRPASLTPGGSAALTLYWQPARRLDADYTTFVQLLNADGVKIGQSDHRPGGVYYPTSLWKPGETLADTHTLSLPAALGRPPYTILVGLYTGTTDLRHLGEPQRIGEIGR
ncbi:MAG: DUF2723 domain-containing protein [Chloroflexi bacterium]|nr:DUF2723 domain-containing protein [Chloroflexota bacterium]